MDYIRQLFTLLNQDNNPTGYHKKTDDYLGEDVVPPGGAGGNNDLSIPFANANSEADRIQEFIQDTCDYFAGRLTYVNDLRCGMARIGDGVTEPLFWCAPLKHPVGFMLNENGFDPVRLVDLERHGFGTLAIYPEADVKICIDSIVDMLKEHRQIQLIESDEEKENGTKAGLPPAENKNV